MNFDVIRKQMESSGYSDAQIDKYRLHVESQKPPPMARVGRGMLDLTQGVKQLGVYGGEKLGIVEPGSHDKYTQDVNQDLGLYEKHVSGFDPLRLAGNFAMGSVVPGATGKNLFTTSLKSGLQGLALGGSMYSPGGVNSLGKAFQTATGGAAGAVLPTLMKPAVKLGQKVYSAGSNLFNRAKNRVNIDAKIDTEIVNNLKITLKETGVDIEQLSDDIINQIKKEVSDTLKSGKTPDTKAIVRKNVLNSAGFTDDFAPTKAQVSRDPKEWTSERELAKLNEGSQITQRYNNQSQLFRNKTDDMAKSIGGKADDDIDAAIQVFEDIKGQWASSQNAVSKVYKQAGIESTGYQAPLSTLKDSVDDLIDVGYDGLVPQIKIISNRIKKLGGVNDDGAVQALPLNKIENLRKEMVKLSSNTNDRTQEFYLRKLIDNLDDDVAENIDVFKPARAAAKKRFDKFSGDMLKGVVDDKSNITTFLKRYIYNGKPEDIIKLKKTVKPQEWNNVKGRVYETIMDKAYQGNRGAESTIFNGKLLAKEMKRVGNSRLKEIFSQKELESLKKLSVTGEWLSSPPPHSTVNYSNTGATVQNAVNKMLQMARMNPSSVGMEILSGMPKIRASVQASNAANAALKGRPSPMITNLRNQQIEQMINQGLLSGTTTMAPGLLNQDFTP